MSDKKLFLSHALRDPSLWDRVDEILHERGEPSTADVIERHRTSETHSWSDDVFLELEWAATEPRRVRISTLATDGVSADLNPNVLFEIQKWEHGDTDSSLSIPEILPERIRTELTLRLEGSTPQTRLQIFAEPDTPAGQLPWESLQFVHRGKHAHELPVVRHTDGYPDRYAHEPVKLDSAPRVLIVMGTPACRATRLVDEWRELRDHLTNAFGCHATLACTGDPAPAIATPVLRGGLHYYSDPCSLLTDEDGYHVVHFVGHGSAPELDARELASVLVNTTSRLAVLHGDPFPNAKPTTLMKAVDHVITEKHATNPFSSLFCWSFYEALLSADRFGSVSHAAARARRALFPETRDPTAVIHWARSLHDQVFEPGRWSGGLAPNRSPAPAERHNGRRESRQLVDYHFEVPSPALANASFREHVHIIPRDHFIPQDPVRHMFRVLRTTFTEPRPAANLLSATFVDTGVDVFDHFLPSERRSLDEIVRDHAASESGRLVVNLFGASGSGKTTMMCHLARELARDDSARWRPVYTTLDEEDSIERFLGSGPRPGEHENPARPIVFLDDPQDVEDPAVTVRTIESLCESFENLILIVARNKSAGLERVYLADGPNRGYLQVRIPHLDWEARRQLVDKWCGVYWESRNLNAAISGLEEIYEGADHFAAECCSTIRNNRHFETVTETPLGVVLFVSFAAHCSPPSCSDDLSEWSERLANFARWGPFQGTPEVQWTRDDVPNRMGSWLKSLSLSQSPEASQSALETAHARLSNEERHWCADSFRTMEQELFQHAERLTNDYWDATEVTQEAFFRIISSRDKGPQWETENLRAYLHKVVRNLAFDLGRQRKRTFSLLDNALQAATRDPDPHDEIEEPDDFVRAAKELRCRVDTELAAWNKKKRLGFFIFLISQLFDHRPRRATILALARQEKMPITGRHAKQIQTWIEIEFPGEAAKWDLSELAALLDGRPED